MRIERIEAIPIQLPPRRVFRWAGLRVGLGGFVIVRIFTNEGICGIGEATPLPDWGGDHGRHSGETQKTVVTVIEDVLAPVLIGSDPLAIERARATMNKYLRGNTYAKTAIDIALHDILGKVAGLPLYQLLGGPYRDRVAVSHMVGIMPNDEAIEEARGAVSDGIGALQIKGGENPQRDISLVRSLRRELGDDVVIRLDANQGYFPVKAAVDIVAQLKDAGANIIEQPVAGHAEMAILARSTSLPVVADESAWDAREALELVSRDGADCLSIYLAKAGGLSGARRVAAIAEATGRPCDVNGSIESGIGNAANLHFAMSAPPVEMPCVIPISAPAGTHPYRVGGHYYEDDIVTEPFSVDGGCLLPINRPGLGVELDLKKLEQFRLK